ncbi:glycosyltransferase involved in cell wall biosynthesis [Ruminiclostridium sufflavum DSM 19573]|uniref:Glycosyltransferase involved in cell wall biosynthesis n=1 Tax=Ruminiclostridium sufflavum DSM 19573 TaxID=1121337 RepID=A0A318XP19_9FIRM|nr:glycosyltransferase [Ruminiclostridium sufflavum]PYG89880.1 glycosyltransferase involved in cell wall biosynthesis [Ruminiclostridium sufflavum DSM 19573]
MNKNIFLSLCMIVKNEEAWLDNCLQSAGNIADEIIIVDTGSTDGTKEICRKYNACIYTFLWNENFSEARNFGLEKASGKWILWLDADEELEIDDTASFLNMLEKSDTDFQMISLINYFGSPPPDPNKSYLFSSYRLFRNNRGIRFTGSIHEHLDIQISSASANYEVIPNARIYHYGYMEHVVEIKEKHKRNLYLLQKEKQGSDYSPWIDYHIASEYYRVKKYIEAFNNINLSLKRFLEKKTIPPSLLYKLKYDILLALGSFEGAWPGINNAIALYPEYVDLHFYKGLILFEKQKPEEAISAFQQCVKLGDNNPRYLTMTGCGGFRAWYFIGRCSEAMGNPSEAINAYSRAISLYPDCQEASDRLFYLKSITIGQ